MRRGLRGLRWGLAGCAAAAGLVFVLLGMPRTAGAALLVLGIALPVGGRRIAAVRLGAWVVLVLAISFGFRVPFREFARRHDGLAMQVHRHGSQGLSLRDRVGVYTLNLAMAVGGLVAGLPEVALEAWLMSFRGPLERTFESDFAMRSVLVRETVAGFFAALAAERGAEVALPARQVAWRSYDQDSPRVSLALNGPLWLSGRAVREGGRWRLDLEGVVECRYPRSSRLTLARLGGESIALDEGLFWALQETGWLHPFTARWRWTVREGDPRLRDPLPELSWRERLLTPGRK